MHWFWFSLTLILKVIETEIHFPICPQTPSNSTWEGYAKYLTAVITPCLPWVPEPFLALSSFSHITRLSCLLFIRRVHSRLRRSPAGPDISRKRAAREPLVPRVHPATLAKRLLTSLETDFVLHHIPVNALAFPPYLLIFAWHGVPLSSETNSQK